MTETEYRFNYVGGSQIKHFDSMLATVRDEARRAALEEAVKMIDAGEASSVDFSLRPGMRMAIRIVSSLNRSPRTLDDVLADIELFGIGKADKPRAWLEAVARTAVEGIAAFQNLVPHHETAARFVDKVNETIRKLLEIK